MTQWLLHRSLCHSSRPCPARPPPAPAQQGLQHPLATRMVAERRDFHTLGIQHTAEPAASVQMSSDELRQVRPDLGEASPLEPLAETGMNDATTAEIVQSLGMKTMLVIEFMVSMSGSCPWNRICAIWHRIMPVSELSQMNVLALCVHNPML